MHVVGISMLSGSEICFPGLSLDKKMGLTKVPASPLR